MGRLTRRALLRVSAVVGAITGTGCAAAHHKCDHHRGPPGTEPPACGDDSAGYGAAYGQTYGQ